jgi:hypothetical protein
MENCAQQGREKEREKVEKSNDNKGKYFPIEHH